MMRLNRLRRFLIVAIMLFMKLSTANAQSAVLPLLAQTVELKEAKKSQTASLATSKEAKKGGVILVKLSPAIENPLLFDKFRRYLKQKHWSSLLIHMQPSGDPWVLAEAVRYLRNLGIKKIVFVVYGQGLDLILKNFNQQKSKQINAVVLLSVFEAPSLGANEQAQRLKFSVLDVYGQFDYPKVRQAVLIRQQQFEGKLYQVAEIAGSQHDYRNQEDALIARVWGFLRQNPSVQRRR